MKSIGTAFVMGSLVHAYSEATNSEYASDLIRDFSEGRYVQGSAKAVVPYVVPFVVSSLSRRSERKKCEREMETLRRGLENHVTE